MKPITESVLVHLHKKFVLVHGAVLALVPKVTCTALGAVTGIKDGTEDQYWRGTGVTPCTKPTLGAVDQCQ